MAAWLRLGVMEGRRRTASERLLRLVGHCKEGATRLAEAEPLQRGTVFQRVWQLLVVREVDHAAGEGLAPVHDGDVHAMRDSKPAGWMVTAWHVDDGMAVASSGVLFDYLVDACAHVYKCSYVP